MPTQQTITSAEIRRSFLDFFASKGHQIVPSASLLPVDDPTLLFTNAGMNQFKDIFLGLREPETPRVADSQKCMRVSGKHNDLDDVGRSPFHHTLFEMLGNWSFGDYYKKEAISWAWELLTRVWALPQDRLYATVFQDDHGQLGRDEEAAGYWRTETDIDPDHICYFGAKDNFWEMGDTGPCGPCSEIHLDMGPEKCDKQDVPGHVCGVNGDCRRYIELWNLVFIQYNREQDGSLVPLPARHVDTGMGFERVVNVMQGADSNYDTDLFMPMIRRLQELTGHSDDERERDRVSYRVIADHVRAITFLIGDGVMPGNEGRGYVLRLILRRAARHGRMLGLTRPFLTEIAKTVIEVMGDPYDELVRRREFILSNDRAGGGPVQPYPGYRAHTARRSHRRRQSAGRRGDPRRGCVPVVRHVRLSARHHARRGEGSSTYCRHSRIPGGAREPAEAGARIRAVWLGRDGRRAGVRRPAAATSR